jgi:hypothetical protein
MKHLNYKVLLGIALVLFISCGIWFAAPNSTYTSDVKWSAVLGSYVTPGIIIVEKRDAITGNLINKPGFKISVSPNPYGAGILTVLDNDSYDANTINYGIIQLKSVPPGTYTIKEIGAPAGYFQDAPDMQAVIEVSESVQTVTLVARDTPKPKELVIIKVDRNTSVIINQPGFTVTITPNPFTGSGTLTVVDNDPNDTDPNFGVIRLINVLERTYTIIEVAPPIGYLVDPTPLIAIVSADEPTGTVVSRDLPSSPRPVPGLSDTGMWIMIGAFALLMSGFMIWRGRRSGITL